MARPLLSIMGRAGCESKGNVTGFGCFNRAERLKRVPRESKTAVNENEVLKSCWTGSNGGALLVRRSTWALLKGQLKKGMCRTVL